MVWGLVPLSKSTYNLKILKKNPDAIREYAHKIQELVLETNGHSMTLEMNRIKTQYHIDNYYIYQDKRIVGVVKIFQGSFYYLGLIPQLKESEYISILETIEDYLGGWRVNRYDATVHDMYLPYLLKLNYRVDYSRIKMRLRLADAKNLVNDDHPITRTFRKGDLTPLIDMIADAYRDSVDEQIGIFSGGMASAEISGILRGKYGEFKPDMTPLVIAEGSTYVEAASMTTISEGEPFIVLIGVRRAEQGKGYGRTLLSWVINKAIEQGYSEIRLWVTIGNTVAYKLYRSIGFIDHTKVHSLTKFLS